MRFLAISDTHGKHHELSLPPADALLHAGDVSRRGKKEEIENFLDWFSKQPHPHKIFIAGNHDFFFEKEAEEHIRAMIPPGIVYLNDSGITVGSVRIWGSPIQPNYHDWAFNRERGSEIRKHWDLIPAGTDILITHGPAHLVLDKTINGLNVGCEDLREAIRRVKPRYHICGHIHETYGKVEQEGTVFLNASVLDFSYNMVNTPFLFDL